MQFSQKEADPAREKPVFPVNEIRMCLVKEGRRTKLIRARRLEDDRREQSNHFFGRGGTIERDFDNSVRGADAHGVK
jgi:hypothetical protein